MQHWIKNAIHHGQPTPATSLWENLISPILSPHGFYPNNKRPAITDGILQIHAQLPRRRQCPASMSAPRPASRRTLGLTPTPIRRRPAPAGNTPNTAKRNAALPRPITRNVSSTLTPDGRESSRLPPAADRSLNTVPTHNASTSAQDTAW